MRTQLIFMMVIIGCVLSVPSHPAHGNESDQTFQVMTLNLLFSETEDRDVRLDRVADFLQEVPVEVVLLQEVVGGPISGTFNSAWDLQCKLAQRGLAYDLSYRLANGLPGILTVGNALLVRGRILFTVAKMLPFVSEELYRDIEVPLRRKVMMSRVSIPDVSQLDVYNTHLCAF